MILRAAVEISSSDIRSRDNLLEDMGLSRLLERWKGREPSFLTACSRVARRRRTQAPESRLRSFRVRGVARTRARSISIQSCSRKGFDEEEPFSFRAITSLLTTAAFSRTR